MTMKHTPGPWLVGQYEPTIEFLAIRNHACVCLPDMGLIALTGRAEDRQSQVDADLISAAPELLDALCRIVDHSKLAEGCPAMLAARSAIAKATGGSNASQT